MLSVPNKDELSAINQFFGQKKVKFLDCLKKITINANDTITLIIEKKEEVINQAVLAGWDKIDSYRDYTKNKKNSLKEQDIKNMLCLAQLKEIADLIAGIHSIMATLEQTDLKDIMLENGEFKVKAQDSTFSNLDKYELVENWQERKKSIKELITLVKERASLQNQLREQIKSTVKISDDLIQYSKGIFNDYVQSFKITLDGLTEIQKKSPLQHLQNFELSVIDLFDDLLNNLILFDKRATEKLAKIRTRNISLPKDFDDNQNRIQKDVDSAIMSYLDSVFSVLNEHIIYSFNPKSTIEFFLKILKSPKKTNLSAFFYSYLEEKINFLNRIAEFLNKDSSNIHKELEEKKQFLTSQLSNLIDNDEGDIRIEIEQSDIESLIGGSLIENSIYRGLLLELHSLNIVQEINEKEIRKKEIELSQKEKNEIVETLEKKLEQLKLQFDQTKKEKENLCQELKETGVKLKTSNNQLTNLQSELEKIQLNDSKNEKLINEYKSEFIVLEKLKSTHENLNQELTKEINDKNGKIEQLETLTEQKDLKIKKLEEQNNQKTDELSKIQLNLEKKINNLKEAYEVERKNISTIKDEKVILDKILGDAKEELKTSKLEINTLQAKLKMEDSSHKEQISDFKNQLEELSTAKLQQEELIQVLAEQIKSKNSEIEKITAKSELLTTQLSHTNQQAAQFEDLKRQFESLQKEKSKLQELLNQYKETANGLNHKILLSENKITTANSEIEDLKKTLQSNQKEKDNLSRTIEEARKALKISKEELTNLKIELEKTQLNYLENKELISQLKLKLSELETLKSTQENLIREFSKEVEKRDTTVNRLTDELDKLQTLNSSSQEEMVQLKNLLDELQAFKLQNEVLVTELNGQMKEKDGEIDRLQVTLKLQEEKNLADNGADEVSEQLDTIREKLQQVQERAIKSESHEKELQKELRKWKTKFEEAKQEITRFKGLNEEGDREIIQAQAKIFNLETQLAAQPSTSQELDRNASSTENEDVLQKGLDKVKGKNNGSTFSLSISSRSNSNTSLEDSDSGIEDDISKLNKALNKIKSGQIPSDIELQDMDSVLQYTNDPEDFSLALQAIYPKDFTDQFQECNEVFEQIRLVLRKQALQAIKERYADSSIYKVDELTIRSLDAEAWLQKKHQLITSADKIINLKLTEVEQLELNCTFEKLFPFSELEHAAVTGKSIEELEKALRNLRTIQLKLTNQIYHKQFSEIEKTFLSYAKFVFVDENLFFKNFVNQVTKVSFDGKKRLMLNEEIAKTILKSITRHIENGSNKWHFLSDSANAELIDKIIKDTKDALVSKNTHLTPEDTKLLIAIATDVLSKHHGLANKKKDWQKTIKLHYAMTEKLIRFRNSVDERITVIGAMKDIKEEIACASEIEAENRDTFPGIVYLPRNCQLISNSGDTSLPRLIIQVAGDLFHRRDKLNIGQTITYRQPVEGRDYEWSVTRSEATCLEYKTKAESNIFYKSFAKTDEKIIFTQMMDAINSFNKSKMVHISLGNCSKDTEKKYRLFISAWNELGKKPRVCCMPNNKLKMKSNEIDKIKDEIKAKLNLYADELQNTANKLDSGCFEKIIESSGRSPYMRNAGSP